MPSLKIRIFKGGDTSPETTLTIPINILRIASQLIPPRVASALQEQGIDLAHIVELSENEEMRGTIAEIERHNENQRIVIAME